MTDADLLQALRDCYDPVMRRNIVELNMVRSASLEPDRDAPGAGIQGVPLRYRARVTLGSNSSDEASNAQLAALVENRLLGMPDISSVEILLVPPVFAILNTRQK